MPSIFLSHTKSYTSFCRKTTLTKHARRTHQIRTENDVTDDDGEETEDDAPSPKVMSKPRAPAKRANKAAAGIKKNIATASNRPSMLRTASSFQEPPTPHSPQSIIRSGSSSRNASFSAADSFGNHMPLIMPPSLHQHQPPTPQSPYYHEDVTDSRAISPTTVIHREDEYNTTPTGPPMQSNTTFDGLRIVCTTPSTHQLLAAQAQTQSSPGSLSSCSSATTNSCQSDYFYRQPTSATGHYPISPGAVPPYPSQMPYSHSAEPQHPTIMSYATNGGMLSPHHQVPVQHHSHQQPQVWYGYPSHHQHHLLQAQTHAQQQRLYYPGVPTQDLGYIKAEPEQNMLPTPRGSFC